MEAPLDTLDELEPEDLPTFALFKNLVLDDPLAPNSDIDSFEWAQLNPDDDLLKQQVPAPPATTDPAQIALMKTADRFANAIDSATGALNADQLAFDLTTGHFIDRPSDRALFGASYTLVLLCPPNKRAVVAYLIAALKWMAGGERIGAVHLIALWSGYVDRILFYPDGPDETDDERWHEIVDDLQLRINRLPNAPAPEAWDDMERYL